MNIDFDKLIRIHNSPANYVFAITGGGTEIIGEILKQGGASKTVLECIVPYSQKSLVDFVGIEPQKYACEKTAVLMAMAAYERSKSIRINNFSKGIAATCKLAINGNERKGRVHAVHVAVQSYSSLKIANLVFKKNRTRLEEEEIAAQLILEMLHWSATNTDPLAKIAGEVVEYKNVEVNDADMLSFLSGQTNFYAPEECNTTNGYEANQIIFPGSFNPLHKNHLQMAKVVSEKLGKPVNFEISISNVDKAKIDFISIHERINQFKEYTDNEYFGNLYLTHAPKFIDKSLMFVNPTFIVGSDTLNRIFDDSYYNSLDEVQDVIDDLYESGVRFVTFERVGHKIGDWKAYTIPDDMISIISDGYEDDGTSSSKIRNDE
jgi:nicotinamide mononucleotide (NMN) deamidase PncC